MSVEVLKRLGYRPRFCVWELTLACNMSCRHCGSFAGRRREAELTHEECMRIADDLVALGCEKVTLGGGEPTLHPRWHEIGKRLSDGGVRVNVISNGWTWSREHLERAKWAKLTNVAFSLDGFEEAHDAVRREGSYERVIAALERCIAEGMQASVVTHINRLNLRQLPELRALLSRLGVASWQLQLGIPSGTMSEHWELVIAPEELLWLVPQISELRTDGVARPVVCPADNIGYFGKYEQLLREREAPINFWIGCRAGCEVIGIESDGQVKGCLSLPSSRHHNDLFTEGSLRREPLSQIWRRADGFSLNRGFREELLDGFCRVCRFRDICRGGCAWTAYSHTRNRFDNPYCFYRQAVLHRRLELLDEEPTAAELEYVEPQPAGG